jgi:uncharacterized protein YnzC (UPF0291/DUF896 family)
MSADVKSLNLSDLEKYGVVDILDKSDLTPEKLKESLKNGKFTD